MSFAVELHPKVTEELQESYEWYEERLEGLGLRLITSVNKRLSDIAEHPERYPKKNKNYHQTTVYDFPYVIIYQILKQKKIVFVVHILHVKKNPASRYKQ